MNTYKLAAGLACLLSCVMPARADLVVVVNRSHPATSLTAEEVADIYLGKNASFTPVDLPVSDAAYTQFYAKVTGKDATQVKAIWTRLIFTGRKQPPKTVDSSAAAIKEVSKTEKGIAYVDRSAVDASVKAVFTVP